VSLLEQPGFKGSEYTRRVQGPDRVSDVRVGLL
jgi:hypothetical protein